MLEKIREFPESPGVYLMKKDNEIIYVGKAKNLKKRVSSYFNREHEDNKTRELVKKIEKIYKKSWQICKKRTRSN